MQAWILSKITASFKNHNIIITRDSGGNYFRDFYETLVEYAILKIIHTRPSYK